MAFLTSLWQNSEVVLLNDEGWVPSPVAGAPTLAVWIYVLLRTDLSLGHGQSISEGTETADTWYIMIESECYYLGSFIIGTSIAIHIIMSITH
jgi:hypothetical protein